MFLGRIVGHSLCKNSSNKVLSKRTFGKVSILPRWEPSSGISALRERYRRMRPFRPAFLVKSHREQNRFGRLATEGFLWHVKVPTASDCAQLVGKDSSGNTCRTSYRRWSQVAFCISGCLCTLSLKSLCPILLVIYQILESTSLLLACLRLP